MGATSNLLKYRISASQPVVTGEWHANFSASRKYAVNNKIPFIAAWSNGDSCGHCVIFESAVNSSYFRNWMKKSGCVYCFKWSGDSDAKVASNIFHWIRKNKNTSYPFVRIYWPSGNVDIATIGDTIDGVKDGTTGGKKCVSYLKSKLKNFFNQPKPEPEPAPTAKFTVTFTDGQGKTLSVVLDVANGSLLSSVQHPTMPSRDGYEFAGWDVAEDYKIDSDIVVNATWIQKEQPIPPSPEPTFDIKTSLSSIASTSGRFRNLKIDAKKQIMFSNNISRLDVVSSLADADIDRKNLTHIRLGENVSALLPSCFVDCGNLSSVHTTGTKLKDIGNNAFSGCSSLVDVTFLQKGTNAKLYNIGLSAFAGSGLKDVNISLSGTSTGTQIQSFAFANCPDLTSMSNIGSNYLADYEFAGCSALHSVNLANSHSFMGSYVFKDCIGLSSVTVPPRTYMIGEGFLQGCSSLTNITFAESPEDPSLLGFDECLHNFMLSGTQLTSLTLPSSITSYTQIQPFAFAGLDKLCSIYFNGMTQNQLVTQTSTKKTYKYKFGVVYTCCKSIWNQAKSTIKKNYKYENLFKDVSLKECDSIITYCISNSIPLVVLAGNKETTPCGHCVMFAVNSLYTTTFLNWLPTANCIIVETDYVQSAAIIKKLMPLIRGQSSLATAGFVVLLMYWKTKNYKHFSDNYGNDQNQSSGIINRIKTAYKGYVRPNEITWTVDSSIFSSNCFGLNHDVTLYSSENKPIAYKNVGSSTYSPLLAYDPEVIVDTRTVDMFKYGQWYFNAIELKAYADRHEIPVFALLESTACGPCEEFKSTIFENEEFQQFMADKRVLLCKCEDSTFAGQEIGFLANTWMTQATEDDPNGYAPYVMPIMMLYWYRSKGSTSDGEHFEPATYKMYAHYNSDNASDPPNCPHLSTYSMVTSWIEENCPNEEMDYAPSAQFDLPQITSYIEENTYPKYKVYPSQLDDTYGRYFPTKDLQPPKDYDTFEVTIDGRTETLKGDFSEPQTPRLNGGTYQYFTMLSNDNPLYATTYDVSGIIFKIAGNLLTNDISSAVQDPEHLSSMQQVMDEVGIESEDDTSKILNITSSFYSNLYVIDEGNIDLNEEAVEEMQEQYGGVFNVLQRLVVQNVKVDSRNVNEICAYLCCEVQLDEDQESVVPSDTSWNSLTMVSCNFVDIQASNQTQLQWLSVFSNL